MRGDISDEQFTSIIATSLPQLYCDFLTSLLAGTMKPTTSGRDLYALVGNGQQQVARFLHHG